VATNEEMEIEGSREKPYRLWHVTGRGEFVAAVAEADTFEEINKIRRRADWRYQITRQGRPIDQKTGYPLLLEPGQDLTLQDG
jgi:hypothetical protein